jgi:hypothetical protein
MPSCLKDPQTLCLASTDAFCGALHQIVFLALSVIRNVGRVSPHRKGNGSVGYRIHHHRDEYRSPAQTAQAHIAMIGGHVVIPIFPIRIPLTPQNKKSCNPSANLRPLGAGCHGVAFRVDQEQLRRPAGRGMASPLVAVSMRDPQCIALSQRTGNTQ